MKKFSQIILTLVVVLSLTTGCVKYNVNMEVKDDKSVTLEILYGIDMSAMGDLAGDGETEDNLDEYKYLEDAGFKVEKYTETKGESKYEGVKISRTFKNIDDITADKKFSLDFNQVFDSEGSDEKKYDESTKYFYKDGSNYVANFVFDLSDTGGQDLSSMADALDMKYTVKLPNKSKSNNATEVSEDGKTLTWKLKIGNKNEVNYEFGLGNSNTVLIIGGVVAAVAVVAVVVVVLSKKKKA